MIPISYFKLLRIIVDIIAIVVVVEPSYDVVARVNSHREIAKVEQTTEQLCRAQHPNCNRTKNVFSCCNQPDNPITPSIIPAMASTLTI